MFLNDESVNYELDQWELDDCATWDCGDTDYLSFDLEVE